MNTFKRLFTYLLIVLFISIFFQSVAILFVKNSKDDRGQAIQKSFQNSFINFISAAGEQGGKKTGGNQLLSTLSNVVDTLSRPEEKYGNAPDRLVVSVARNSSVEEYRPQQTPAAPSNATASQVSNAKKDQTSQNGSLQPEAAAGQAVDIPYGKRIIFHTLSYGERLSDVARTYGMPMEALKKINGFGDSYRIYVGQKIMVIQTPITAEPVFAETAAPAKKQPAASEENAKSAAVTKTLGDDIGNILKNAKSSKMIRRVQAAEGDESLQTASAEDKKTAAAAVSKSPLTQQSRENVTPATSNSSKDPLSEIIKSAKKKRRVFKWPTRGEVSSKFGMRLHPVRSEMAFHSGIDIAQRAGISIKPAMGGKVIFAGWQGGYGKMVEIKHPKGYTTRYAHMSKIKVKCGQEVTSTTTIGNVGDTGTSTGYHVHFEIRKYNKPLNPLAFLQN